MSQVSHALERIKHPSVDPSRPLPFFDKLRLWLHGRLIMSVQQSTWLCHASLDPYNKTEFMDWTWTNFILDWKNGNAIHINRSLHFQLCCSTNLECHTSKYPSLTISHFIET